ncbi:MAG: FG-GAP-like repeat-containing protein, partial [candidate division KSB1 bacterium]|nr:FG-GAP-like repeat-containing protein [candidate division KSB1 bacterium]
MTHKIPLILSALLCFWVETIAGGNQNLTLKYHRCGISDRDLLGIRTSLTREPDTKASSPDTLRLLAIRVEFQEDNLGTTTGNGRFALSPAKDIMIDPPPHDRRYFESQLKALANYYQRVSNGKLILKGEVYPQELQRAYQLPHQMSYYHPANSEELDDQRLSELFRDAFLAADSQDSINFSNYDCFILFHAGVGADFSFDIDLTPNDIPSAFLSFKDLKETIGKEEPDFQGIPVNKGTFFIRDGLILPETQNQEELEIGLLGTVAIMFGHQLGLPNLYNTDTGRPGIGKWGLMDQGSGNYSGLLPAEPCAWSKVFLGWEKPILLDTSSARQIPVAAPRAWNKNKIYKIPINSKEYFLIENRQRDINRDQIAVARDENGVKIELKEDGKILAADTFRVITQVDEYDFGLPGSGILIWHIDEAVIEAKYHENRVNSDPEHRGVDLEEAHGSQDIGKYYGFLDPASGSENGIAENAFWADNESNKTVNHSDTVAFTPYTTPDSRAYSRANSHIFIFNFSNLHKNKSDSIMTFDLRVGLYQKGFPQNTGASFGTNSVAVGDLEGDGITEIVATSTNGKVFAWHEDGSKVVTNSESTFSVSLHGDTTWAQVALFAEVNDSINLSPALADLDGDGDLEILVASQNGRIYAWQHIDETIKDGRADLMPLFPINLDHPVTTTPVVLNLEGTTSKQEAVVGTQMGEIIALGNEGLLWQKALKAGAIAGLARYGTDRLVATTANGFIFLLNSQGDILWEKDYNLWGQSTYPAVGDLSGDGNLDVVVCFKNGRIEALDQQGNRLSGFEYTQAASNISAPALGDIDGDGYLEIVVAGDNRIFAFNHNGTLVTNFPIELERGRELSKEKWQMEDGRWKIAVQEPSEDIYGTPILGDL